VRAPAQSAARIAGVAFLLVAVAGFVPGLTSGLYDGLEFAGDEGDAELLGLFAVSVLHNLVHGLFGLAGLALAATPGGARSFLLGGGGLYLALALLGLVGGGEWLPANGADDLLHLGLGGALVAAGLATARAARSSSHA
jgi:hypothetical protein